MCSKPSISGFLTRMSMVSPFSMLAMYYYHSPEGQRFLQGRDIRIVLAAVGIVAAYVLIRTRRRLPSESRIWAIYRYLNAATIAAVLWLSVDWFRREDWIYQLLIIFPEFYENGIRYSILIFAGWLGWTIAFSECFRWITIAFQTNKSEPADTGS